MSFIVGFFMVGATRVELAFTPWDVPPVHKRSLIISKTEFKCMVGATRIELATSRPPDVRATTAPSPVILIYDIGEQIKLAFTLCCVPPVPFCISRS